ncbi:hypothetical protein HOE04_01350 [archaeon]|jgi:hypothetical protein|nr:hypothetical protein [archaeon]
MAFNILIPELNNKPKNSKDAIINILTLEWPLTLKQIYNKIKKQYTYTSTYQSVYKAVKELTESKVLKSKNKEYEININWIKQVQSFTDIVETNYFTKERIQNISGIKDSKKSDNIIILNFETIFDAEKYLYYFIKNELSKKPKQTICYEIKHEWKRLFYLRAEYNYIKKLLKQKHKIYFLCSGNSELEKQSKEFYQSLGAKFKITKQKITHDTLVFNNFFIQIFIPEDLNKKIKHSLNQKDILELLKTLEKKSSIKIIINKDSDLTNEIKKQIIKQF